MEMCYEIKFLLLIRGGSDSVMSVAAGSSFI